MSGPIELEIRPVPERLRYWARQLAEGLDELALRAVAASIALVIIADELESMEEVAGDPDDTPGP